MMMHEDIAAFALDYVQKKGATYAEVRVEDTTAHSTVMKNGVVEATGFDKYHGIGIRFIVKNKMGFVSTNELTKKKIKPMILKAVRTTKGLKSLGQKTFFAEEKSHNATYEVKQKIKLADLSIQERIAYLQQGEKAMLDSGVAVPSRYVGYSDHDTKEFLINSDGSKIYSHVPKLNMYYFLTIAEAGKMTQRYWAYGGAGGWEIATGWNIPKILHEEVTSMKDNLVNGVKSPKGQMPIICGPQVTGIMCHESVGHPYEADRILGREAAQAGESFVTEKMIGRKIASDIVTVVDDPTIANSYGYYQYDSEGVKARRKFLIKDGHIKEFLHNRETAYKMGVTSNGSARASDYDKEGIVRMSNTFLLPGTLKEEELFEGVKKGVFLKNFMEWNIDDRRLNQKYTGAEAYLIENGKITKPIIHPVLEVTTTKLWPAVDAIANNLELHSGECGKGEPMQGIPALLGGPSMRLQGLRIK
jgi:TldD protein